MTTGSKNCVRYSGSPFGTLNFLQRAHARCGILAHLVVMWTDDEDDSTMTRYVESSSWSVKQEDGQWDVVFAC